MDRFLSRYASLVSCTLSGFDRDDLALLEAIARGELATTGFRNRDIRRLLHPKAMNASRDEVRRLSAKTSRRLRMLRAHGLIQKVPRTHRYRISSRGRLLAAALFATRAASVKQLLPMAA